MSTGTPVISDDIRVGRMLYFSVVQLESAFHALLPGDASLAGERAEIRKLIEGFVSKPQYQLVRRQREGK